MESDQTDSGPTSANIARPVTLSDVTYEAVEEHGELGEVKL